MFKLPYFYYYIVAWLLIVSLQRMQTRQGKMKGAFPSAVLASCTVALVVFLILGFWFMPHWWYPLAFFGMSAVTGFVPIPDKIGSWLAVFLAPPLCVLSYLSLFGVIG